MWSVKFSCSEFSFALSPNSSDFSSFTSMWMPPLYQPCPEEALPGNEAMRYQSFPFPFAGIVNSVSKWNFSFPLPVMKKKITTLITLAKFTFDYGGFVLPEVSPPPCNVSFNPSVVAWKCEILVHLPCLSFYFCLFFFWCNFVDILESR